MNDCRGEGMRTKSFLSIYLSLFFSLSSSVTGYSQEKLEKIVFGVNGLSGPSAHGFVPKDSGLYEKYGLDVELVLFQAGTQLTQATLAGGVKIALENHPPNHQCVWR
jgi:ABC-type nitrate/sulfonate/bicarbonate transport system substrate-binding protein